MEKHWASIEKLVELIEKSISPNSLVEHNVKLPDLTSPKRRLRQCDIVITSGTPQRQTKTIIEVQDRVSKLDLNTFQGFTRKMVDVGAQHLICVSKKGFTKSIIEKAKNSGGTIRLVTLNKFEPSNFPIEIPSLNVYHNLIQLEIREYPEISFTTEKEVLIEFSDLILEIPQLNVKYNCVDLANYLLSFVIKPEKSGETLITFPNINFDLNILHQGIRYKVDMFSWKVHFNVTTHEIPVYGYSYEQLDSGIIAWFLESCSEVAGRKRFVRMPLIPNNDGTFETTFTITK